MDTVLTIDLEHCPWLHEGLAAKDALTDQQILWIHGHYTTGKTNFAMHLTQIPNENWALWNSPWFEDRISIMSDWIKHTETQWAVSGKNFGLVLDGVWDCENGCKMNDICVTLQTIREGFDYTIDGVQGQVHVGASPVVILTPHPPPPAVVADPTRWVVMAV